MATEPENGEDELGFVGVDDMIQLMDLTEETLLKNIQIRYKNEKIYTYVGSILVAVNPYRMFNIYGLDMVKRYQGQVLGTLPPHLFAIGSAAFAKMVRDNENQVVVISGESGAGKTESTKLTMQYLAAVNTAASNLITEQILEASPLLESFGNAKTIRNDNSSRFGKYVEVYFKGGAIIGAKTSDYLLEKSRIVTQAADERNYHVFYEILGGLTDEQKQKYGLQTADKYFYLNQGGSCELQSRDENKNYQDLQSSMDVLGFTGREQQTIYKILASVLHLGNVYFNKKQDSDHVEIGSGAEIGWISHLLELSEDWLKQALTNKVTEARHERLLTPFNIDQALDTRDAIAKALYQRLFTWLVERVNQIVKGAERDNRVTSIAILDIFGFEDFMVNSFEQLCINYANEALQLYFNRHIFKLEQAEYHRERIDWTIITFHDNQPTIDLIARKPKGIIHILDDESNFPKGTDHSFVEKCHFVHGSNALYVKPRLSGNEFAVMHYAGKVTYNINQFLDKNRDTLRSDVMELIIQSKNEIISQMFLDLREQTLNRTVSKLTGLYVTTKPKTPTVAASFHESLVLLMETMGKCNPWFVRCIKPNNDKAAMLFEVPIVYSQLRYSGMLETIRIRKMGYPVRLRFHLFADRFHVLRRDRTLKKSKGKAKPKKGPNHPADEKAACFEILDGLGPTYKGAWQLGVSKVFLREFLAYRLEDMKSKVITDSVLILQCMVRGYLARRNYSIKKSAAIKIQAITKGWVARTRYKRMREGFIRAQAQYRMRKQRRSYTQMLADVRRRKQEDEQRQRDLYRQEDERRRQEELESRRRQEEERRRIEAEQAQWRREEEARLRQEAADRERMVKFVQTSLTSRSAPLGTASAAYHHPHNSTLMNALKPASHLVKSRLDHFERSKPVRNLSRREMEEQEERQARTVAGVTQLEIPTDLAYVFQKLDNWQPVHNERHLVNVVGNVVPRDMNFILPSDVDAHVFSKFVKVYFKEPWKMRKDVIPGPFLAKQSDMEAREAVALFSLVLRFMNDANLTGMREKVLADYIIQRGLSKDSLRDEIYCQLCNQTWLNKNDANCERGWLLMAHCLSSFPPSPVLAKYLLKYVSDQAYNGYKAYCQHKLLQCVTLAPSMCRYYPPSLLEWKAARKRAGMAISAKFPDDESDVAHIESWTTGEELVSHLLQSRQVNEGTHGWRVQLHDDTDMYETSGLDYVLDLISEMEVPPAFPWTQAAFLVTTEHATDTSSVRKELFSNSPHNPAALRTVELQIPELREPVPVPPRPAPQPEQFFQYGGSPASTDSRHSSPESDINGNDNAALSRTSILNVRYVDKQSAPHPPELTRAPSPPPPQPPPLSSNGQMDRNMRLSTSNLNRRYDPSAKQEDLSLSGNKLNRRYSQEPDGAARAFANSSVPNGDISEDSAFKLSPNNLNKRYSKNNAPTSDNFRESHTAHDEIVRRQRSSDYNNRWETQDRQSLGSRGSGNPVDMDQWLDNVFNPILNPRVEDLNDAKSVNQRLKGGGRGVPGVPNSQVPVGPYTSVISTGLTPQAPLNPLNPPNIYGGPSIRGRVQQFERSSHHPQHHQHHHPHHPSNQHHYQQHAPPAPVLMPSANQLAAQQLAQQQALLMAQPDQQTVVLQSRLQHQALENQLLQQSVQGELLKQQLHHLQQQQIVTQTPAAAAAPPLVDARFASYDPVYGAAAAGPSNRVVVQQDRRGQPPLVNSSQGAPAFTVELHAGGQSITTSPTHSPRPTRKYKTPAPLPHHNEQYNSVPVARPTSPVANGGPAAHRVAPPVSPKPSRRVRVASPPPAVASTSSIHQSTSFTAPPPPPPPPPPVVYKSPVQQGMIKGTDGTIRAVRVGKIQWPPPKQDDHRNKPEVGKLDIDEKKVKDSIRVSKSKEDVHEQMMQLIRSRSSEPQPPAPLSVVAEPRPAVHNEEPQEDFSINMADRRAVLEKQLSQAGILQGKQQQQQQQQQQQRSSRPSSSESAQRFSPPPLIPPSQHYTSPPHFDPHGPPPPPPAPPPLPPGVSLDPRPVNRDSLKRRSTKSRRAPRPPVDEPPVVEVTRVPTPEPDTTVDLGALEHVRTQLYTQSYSPFYTYNRVPWVLEIRKEVFTPSEKLENPVLLNLIFCQIVQDLFSSSCLRIAKDDRVRMRSFLEGQGITPRTAMNSTKTQVKRQVVDTAREWPYYFARLFPVNGGRKLSHVSILAVSHSGLRLLSRHHDLVDDSLRVEQHYKFDEIVDVSVPKPTALQIHTNKDQYIILYTPKAHLIQSMIDSFCIETDKSSIFVRAIRNYVTRESTLLSFEEGDIIKLTNRNMMLDQGWLYGALHGRTGLFPAEYIKPLARHHDAEANGEPSTPPQEPGNDSSDNLYHTLPDGGKYSMLEFAMLHFRQSPFRYEMLRSEGTGSIHGTFKLISSIKAKTMQKEHNKKRGISDWTWKDQADMVKWSKSPIQASLLKFESTQMNKMALECFLNVMRFMGDYPFSKSQKAADCVYYILKACHNHPELRDEVYCQLIKQTTNNRSTRSESTQQGWRLMAIVTAYFDTTDILKPYLINYLEQTANDNQRTHQAVAAQSLQNIRTTYKYGGRKNVPSRIEIEALSRGRNTKRQTCLLPVGVPVTLNVKSCSVVFDAVQQICDKLDLQEGLERDEFTIFYVVNAENRYYPLGREEYIFDVTTELANQKKDFHLLCQRTSWVFPLHLDGNSMYIDVMYSQCLPDYQDGFLLPMPDATLPKYIKEELCMLAALQMKAAHSTTVPPQKELIKFVPENAQQASDMSAQKWCNGIHEKIRSIDHLNAHSAKCTFLDILSKWPLFGSTFFKIKSVADPRVKGECHLAINRSGVHFLHLKTHESIISYPMSEMISTRRFKSEKSVNYLDMKCGNLMVQTITRIETDQGKDISTLIAQYIQILTQSRDTPVDRL